MGADLDCVVLVIQAIHFEELKLVYSSIWAISLWASQGGASGKEPTRQHRKCNEMWIQSLGWKDPWRRAWQSTPAFLPGESHGQRSLVACIPESRKELDTTEVA